MLFDIGGGRSVCVADIAEMRVTKNIDGVPLLSIRMRDQRIPVGVVQTQVGVDLHQLREQIEEASRLEVGLHDTLRQLCSAVETLALEVRQGRLK